MNANEDGSWAERNPPLSGFYAYKNTFDENTVWLDVPKNRKWPEELSHQLRKLTDPTVTFYNTSNPYTDPGTPDMDGPMSAPQHKQYLQPQHDQWNMDPQLQDPHAGYHPHGLEALSAAALYSPAEANMVPRPVPMNRRVFDGPFEHSSLDNEPGVSSISPLAATSSSNNLNFLLNPASAMDSPIDPSLMSPAANQPPPASLLTASSQDNTPGPRSHGEAESEHKVAFLLRHFSESPGQWCVDK